MGGKVTILIVDDKEENIFALEKLLEKPDRSFLTAKSGKDGLTIALKNIPDLVILDVHMPEMDGFEVAQVLKSNKKTKEIPVIFTSAEKKERHSIMKGFEEGAVDYLSKPLDPDVTRAKVSAQLKIQQQKKELVEKNISLENAEMRINQLNQELQRNLVELEISKQQVEHASRLKSEFISTMSHELRTPLNAIIGFSELLVDKKVGEINSRQEQYLEDILRSGNHLLRLINDILDLSKIEAGKMEILLEPCGVKEVMEEVCSVIKSLADAKGIAIVVSIAAQVVDIEADRIKLKQVLYNLLSNAIKFTDRGGKVEIAVEPGAKNSVAIQIKDTGIGISPEGIRKLFSPFLQLNAGPSEKQQGTGLGLMLARKFIELHQGSISVDSEVGKGTVFTVLLPQSH
ncbi:ATP-binding protein [Chryseolinea soli]|uniref:histidine kinase n=1 Tax=Chryseolinea soli TaxID=2321403 RepID=A0A385SZ60_9BACT|nr:ATP-binding protein [Chryseolinea soli]AYB35080.1 response regulator [Chryseolinea soli]